MFVRFGLTILSRLPRLRAATGGDFGATVGAETEAGTGTGTGDLAGDSIAAAELLVLMGSGLLDTFVAETVTGDATGVLVTLGSLLVGGGRGGSMLSFGT